MKSKLLGLCALTAASLLAQTPGSGKVAVINFQGALLATKDGQKAAADLEAKSSPKRKLLETKQGEINAMKDQLQKGANTLSDTAKQDLYRKIDMQTKSLNRDAEDAEAELQQEQQKVVQELGQKLNVVIDKYARDNGLTLVVDVSSPQTPVVYASNTIDITRDIVGLYDKNAPGAPATTTTSHAPATSTPGATHTPTPAAASRPATTPAHP